MSSHSDSPPKPRPLRATWTNLTPEQLLAQCEVDTYRASGPGGQKRNKTSSAVRLRHPPTGFIVIAEESRSQHENKAKALLRMRESLFLHWRDAVEAASVVDHPDYAPARDVDGRLHLRVKDPRFWPAAGVVMDVIEATGGQVSTAAGWLGTSTANLIDFLRTDPKVWQHANQIRAHFQLKPLKMREG